MSTSVVQKIDIEGRNCIKVTQRKSQVTERETSGDFKTLLTEDVAVVYECSSPAGGAVTVSWQFLRLKKDDCSSWKSSIHLGINWLGYTSFSTTNHRLSFIACSSAKFTQPSCAWPGERSFLIMSICHRIESHFSLEVWPDLFCCLAHMWGKTNLLANITDLKWFNLHHDSTTLTNVCVPSTLKFHSAPLIVINIINKLFAANLHSLSFSY